MGCGRPLLLTHPTQTRVADPLFISRILKGNLAPGGAVAKITGKEGLEFTGRARTFDTEDAFVEAVEKGEIKKGEKTVAVLRYLGPRGGPGESVFRDPPYSTLPVYDTNVSLGSTPFPGFLACSAISLLRWSLFLLSLSVFPLLPPDHTPVSLLGRGFSLSLWYSFHRQSTESFCWKPSRFSVSTVPETWKCELRTGVPRLSGGTPEPM